MLDKIDFVYLNYLVVDEQYRNNKVGSYIIEWVKRMFENRTLVAEVEKPEQEAPNNDQRIKRLNFYYKNGFKDGMTEYNWNGTNMFYVYTGEVHDHIVMKNLRDITPTIKNEKPHMKSI